MTGHVERGTVSHDAPTTVEDAVEDATTEAGLLGALVGLPGMGPRRLARLLARCSPSEAFDVVRGRRPAPEALVSGVPRAVRDAWVVAAAQVDPAEVARRCRSAGVDVVRHGGIGYPDALVHDPHPPVVLFTRGDRACLDGRRVGVIGTRNPTRAGLDTAAELGEHLARRGVVVVSGLARGIDAAAHRGALRARATAPVAVVGNGPDAPYPRQNRELWEAVARVGHLMSEWPPGTPPDAFRFPLRNRIIAGLVEVLVVVESRESGGSLSTVAAAIERGVSVMAVPGSPRVRSSAGTNRLLADGVAPVMSADDVMVALDLDTRRLADPRSDQRPLPDDNGRRVLEWCRAAPVTLDHVVVFLGVSVSEAAMVLARLERDGWVAEMGGWFEPIGAWSATPGGDESNLETT